jgi:ATP-GRASP peptide maturase of grasp-with-spasm system
MILVLSFDTFEQGTDPVIDWLIYHKADFTRITIADIVNRNQNWRVNITNGELLLNGANIADKVNVIWYRRFLFDFSLRIDPDHSQYSKLNTAVKQELKVFFNYLCKALEGKKWLPHYTAFGLDELELLKKARECGLNVPETIVTNSREELLNFYDACGSGIITKSITDESKSYFTDGDNSYFSYTHSFRREEITELEPWFFPSLFQQKVEADFELRVFYLDGEFYSTAIIIADDKREVDRKLYNSSKLTHQVVYQMPVELEAKLHHFMQQAGMNTGCLDLIKDKNGDYYFLEVNVVGQYLSQSVKCNYSLDQKIAEWLMKHDKN